VVESIAERVAREWWQLWGPRTDSPLDAQVSLHQCIQAAIVEAVTAERVACADLVEHLDVLVNLRESFVLAILARRVGAPTLKP